VAAGVVAAAAAAESPNVLVTAFNSSTCSDELLRQRERKKVRVHQLIEQSVLRRWEVVSTAAGGSGRPGS
jgi:hypothetical protein